MGLTGDFRQLRQLLEGLKQLPRELGRSGRLNRAVAEEAMNQVVEGFEQGRDPYGTPWKPTRRGGAILRNTGRLLNSRSYTLNDRGFTIHFAAKYAATHNFGAVIKPKPGTKALAFKLFRGRKWIFAKKVTIPQRQFVPDPKRSLGRIWTPALRRAAQEALRAVLRGKP